MKHEIPEERVRRAALALEDCKRSKRKIMDAGRDYWRADADIQHFERRIEIYKTAREQMLKIKEELRKILDESP